MIKEPLCSNFQKYKFKSTLKNKTVLCQKNVKVRYIDLKFLMININYVTTSKSYFFEFFISLDKLLMYSIKTIHKNDLKKYIILQNLNELLLTKKCCHYLSEESMKTVLCPSKIELT